MVFKRDTPKEHRPAGYDPTLDRRQPPSGPGCFTVLIALIALVGALVPVGFGVTTLLRRGQPTPASTVLFESFAPSATAQEPTATIDGWSATGTALFFATPTLEPTNEPTLDYCWFLTPTAIPSATPIAVTPDGWAATGTAVYLQTGTPTSTPTSTQPPPRAWCDSAPTPTNTPSLTPIPRNTQPPTIPPSRKRSKR